MTLMEWFLDTYIYAIGEAGIFWMIVAISLAVIDSAQPKSNSPKRESECGDWMLRRN
jgi:hypothetical protein